MRRLASRPKATATRLEHEDVGALVEDLEHLVALLLERQATLLALVGFVWGGACAHVVFVFVCARHAAAATTATKYCVPLSRNTAPVALTMAPECVGVCVQKTKSMRLASRARLRVCVCLLRTLLRAKTYA